MELDIRKKLDPAVLKQASNNQLQAALSEVLQNWLDPILARKRSRAQHGMSKGGTIDYRVSGRMYADRHRILPGVTCDVVLKGSGGEGIIRCDLDKTEKAVRRVIKSIEEELFGEERVLRGE